MTHVLNRLYVNNASLVAIMLYQAFCLLYNIWQLVCVIQWLLFPCYKWIYKSKPVNSSSAEHYAFIHPVIILFTLASLYESLWEALLIFAWIIFIIIFIIYYTCLVIILFIIELNFKCFFLFFQFGGDLKMFRAAGQAEILRAHQKDEFYLSHLRSLVTDVFQGTFGIFRFFLLLSSLYYIVKLELATFLLNLLSNFLPR